MTTQVLEDMSVESQELQELGEILFRAGIGSHNATPRQRVQIALTKISNLEMHSNNLLACAHVLNQYGVPGATSVAQRISLFGKRISEELQDLQARYTIAGIKFSAYYNQMQIDLNTLLALTEYFEQRLDGKRMPLKHSVVVVTKETPNCEEGTRGLVEALNYHKDGYLQSYDLRLYDNTIVKGLPPSSLTLLADA